MDNQLVRELNGQILHIPDLKLLLYPDWDVARHEDEQEIRKEILGEFAHRWYKDNRKKKILRDGNFVLIAGYFWSGSKIERFRPLAQFANWYFPWDDEIDCGPLKNNKTGTVQYGVDTIKFLKWCLEPDNYYPTRSPRPVTSTNHQTDCYEEIGKALQNGQSKEALRRYADSMYEYVAAVCDVQRQREAGLPSWEEYVENRLRTIGAIPCLMTMEYAYGLKIPAWVYEHTATKAMFRETSFSIFIVNDILSLRKEIAENQFDSAIPLKLHHQKHRNVQEALDEVILDLQRSRTTFDTAERSLLAAAGALCTETQADIRMLVQGCKNLMVGNLKWSYDSPPPVACLYLTSSPALGCRSLDTALTTQVVHLQSG